MSLKRGLFICLIITGFMTWSQCGGKKSTAAKTDEPNLVEKAGPVSQTEEEKQQAQLNSETKGIFIEKVSLLPDPPKAKIDITVEAVIKPENPEGVTRKYVYFVNTKQVREDSNNVFPATYFKKGDLIFADLILFKDGKEFLSKRSSMFTIVNSPPVIKNVKFPEITGPGNYDIILEAEDPDNDPITYSVENVNQSIVPAVDAMGLIRIKVPDNPPESITFTAIAKDSENLASRQEITLTFKKNTTPPPQ